MFIKQFLLFLYITELGVWNNNSQNIQKKSQKYNINLAFYFNIDVAIRNV